MQLNWTYAISTGGGAVLCMIAACCRQWRKNIRDRENVTSRMKDVVVSNQPMEHIHSNSHLPHSSSTIDIPRNSRLHSLEVEYIPTPEICKNPLYIEPTRINFDEADSIEDIIKSRQPPAINIYKPDDHIRDMIIEELITRYNTICGTSLSRGDMYQKYNMFSCADDIRRLKEDIIHVTVN